MAIAAPVPDPVRVAEPSEVCPAVNAIVPVGKALPVVTRKVTAKRVEAVEAMVAGPAVIVMVVPMTAGTTVTRDRS